MRIERTAGRDQAQLLRREAEVLRRARHPGVVELVDLVEDDTSVVLVTAEPDGPRLSDSDLTSPEIAGVIAVLATTLADLHDIGVSHGSVSAERIALDESGRPVLGGFELAQVLEGSPGKWPTSAQAAADTKALGRLTENLLLSRTVAGDAASTALCRLIAPLLNETDRARARITARRLARDIATSVPDVRLPVRRHGAPETHESRLVDEADGRDQADGRDETDGRDRPFGSDSSRLTARRPAVPFVLATTVAIAIVVACHPRPGRPPPSPTMAVAGPVAPRSSTSVATPVLPPLPPPRYVGDVMTIGLSRYKVGEASDVMAFGRWSCTWPMLIVARPRTGQVWLFPRLATDQPVRALEVGRVAGLVGVHSETRGACDQLRVDRSSAPAVPLDLSSVG